MRVQRSTDGRGAGELTAPDQGAGQSNPAVTLLPALALVVIVRGPAGCRTQGGAIAWRDIGGARWSRGRRRWFGARIRTSPLLDRGSSIAGPSCGLVAAAMIMIAGPCSRWQHGAGTGCGCRRAARRGRGCWCGAQSRRAWFAARWQSLVSRGRRASRPRSFPGLPWIGGGQRTFRPRQRRRRRWHQIRSRIRSQGRRSRGRARGRRWAESHGIRGC